MKAWLSLLLLLCCLLPVRVHAAALVDECAKEEEAWLRLSGFEEPRQNLSQALRWPNAPDEDARPLAAAGSVGGAVYAVEGAQRAQVSIYHAWGTVAIRQQEGMALGFQKGAALSDYTRPWLDQGRILLFTPDGWRSVWRTSRAAYLFAQKALQPASEAPYYGLNVYCSTDNSVFQPVQVALSGLRAARDEGGRTTWQHETYSFTLPEQTRFVRLELREAQAIPLESGGTYQVANGNMLLAQVSFWGDAVRPGSFDTIAPSRPESEAPPQPSSSRDPDLQTSTEKPEDESSKESSKDRSSSRRSRAPSKRASSGREEKSRQPAQNIIIVYGNPSASPSSAAHSSEPAPSAPQKKPGQAQSTDSAPPAALLQRSEQNGGNGKSQLLFGVFLIAALILLAVAARKKE